MVLKAEKNVEFNEKIKKKNCVQKTDNYKLVENWMDKTKEKVLILLYKNYKQEHRFALFLLNLTLFSIATCLNCKYLPILTKTLLAEQ